MAGLVPAIPINPAWNRPKRDARHKAGHDGAERDNQPANIALW